MPADVSPAASYATATANLRTATQWLLTAAAAAGAASVAGVQLTSIGSLGPDDWPRLIVAAIGLAAGLGSVGYMIFQASLLLSDEWITLAQLELEPFKAELRASGRRRDKHRLDEIDRIHNDLESYQDEFFRSAAVSLLDLYQRLIAANDKARKSPTPKNVQTAADLRKVVDTVVQAANYSYTRARFAALRQHLARAGAVFVAGIVVFAYAANPPKPASKSSTTGHATIQSSPAPKATPARSTASQRARPAG